MLIDRDVPEVARLDSYPVHCVPEHIELVASMIKAKWSGNERLYLYTNCICNVVLGGMTVARQYDTMIYSKEADAVLLLSRVLNPEDLVSVFEKYAIPYTLIGAANYVEDDFLDNPDIPGFFPVRDEAVLKEAIDEAMGHGIMATDVYVDTSWHFRLGYQDEVTPGVYEFKIIYKINGTGIVDTGKNCSLIINNGMENNILPANLAATVQSLGLFPVIKDGHPSYVVPDNSVLFKL